MLARRRRAGPDRRSAQRRGNSGVQAAGPRRAGAVDWIEKSDVAALREGVIEKMELQIGMPVKKDGAIGILHQRSPS